MELDGGFTAALLSLPVLVTKGKLITSTSSCLKQYHQVLTPIK